VRNALLGVMGLVLGGCAAKGHYVWADDYVNKAAVEKHADRAYRINSGDLLTVRVLNHDEMSGKVRVRTDGRITLPFLNDTDAEGHSPDALALALSDRFKSYVNNPVVTVSVDEARPFTVSVMGEVSNPGMYPLEPTSGVLQALAAAGGFTQYAHEDRIFVLRREREDATPTRIRFDYGALSRAEGQSAAFKLQRSDIVVVE
jgi:polysaccharide biosynthesis/export protein